MNDEAGMLTLDALSRLVAEERIDTVAVVFPDLYGRLMGKRVDADFFLEHVAESGTHACNYLLTVDMEMEPVIGYTFANWEKGYGDFLLVPDLSTLRAAGWLNRTAMVICDLKDDANHKPILQAPRTILKTQIQRATDHGYRTMAGTELEHFLFRNTYREAYKKNYSSLEPAGWYLEDYHMLQGSREEDFNGTVRRQLRQSGIPVESAKGEWGRGQHEINIKYADALDPRA